MADIVFAPICSNCGLPIYMDIEVENVDHINSTVFTHQSMTLHHIRISPYVCPNCKAHFECVIMPTRLPYEFPNDVPKLCMKPYDPVIINPVKMIKEN